MIKKIFSKDTLSIILILLGIATIIYPRIDKYYHDLAQEAIMKNYLENMANIKVMEEELEEVNSKYEGNIKGTESSEKNQGLRELHEEWPVEGILSIEKIDLLMPVLKGATKEHLNISITSIDNGNKPWKGNNYAIAGHRSRTFGRHFNRLNELEINDEILLMDNEDNKYIYKVFSKEIVDKKEVSVLEDNGESQITLITCHPITVKSPSTRLVVKGKQINLR